MKLTPNQIIEHAVGMLYQEYFKLRQEKQYQEEYDAMGTLISMLYKDRQHMRKTYKLDI